MIITLSVDTTGSAGSAIGYISSGLIDGRIEAIQIDYNASAPATTDVTITLDTPQAHTIATLSNSNTDTVLYPSYALTDGTGAGRAQFAKYYPKGYPITVSVSGCDALTDAVIVRIAISGRLHSYNDNTPRTYAQQILSTSPLALWALGDATATTAQDSTINGYDGTYNNISTQGDAFNDGTISWQWDGTSGYVDTYSATLASKINLSNGALSMWVKIPADEWANGANGWLYDIFIDVNNRIFINKITTGIIRTTYRGAGTTDRSVDYDPNDRLDWFHIAYTWDFGNTTVQLYIDGASVGTLSLTDLATGTPDGTGLVIGAFSGASGAQIKGNIKYFALYDKTLTQAEITRLYIAGAS